jgi:uncharacterized protein
MLMRHLVVGLIAIAAVGLPAVAADSPSETHKQAATELLRVMDVERTMIGGASAMTDAMVQQNAMLAPYRDVILKWAGTFMTWETFGPKFVTLYTESFTESELRDLLAFYRTPTGKKALAVMPDLMQRGAMLGGEVAKEHAPELERMVRERATELEKRAAKP